MSSPDLKPIPGVPGAAAAKPKTTSNPYDSLAPGSTSTLPEILKKAHATLGNAQDSRFTQQLQAHADKQAQLDTQNATSKQQQKKTLEGKKSQAFKSAQEDFHKHGPQGPFESFYAAVALWTALYYANKEYDKDYNEQQSQQSKSNAPIPKPTKDTSIGVELGEDDDGHLKMETTSQDPDVQNTMGGFANDWAKQSMSPYRLHDDGFWHVNGTSESPKVNLNTKEGKEFLELLKGDNGLQAKFNNTPGAKMKLEINDSTYKTPGLTMMK